MAKTVGPVWIVQPSSLGEIDQMPHPEHPIVLPPDTPEDGAHPEHPIVIPDPGTPPSGAHPEHPIVLPGDPEWGDDLKPTHPIVLPPDAYPDNSLPPGLEAVGELDFYQRKTLGINWDESFDPAQAVGVYAGSGEGDLTLVRTVANDGSSSVTYPQDFTGEVTIRVAGINGYLEGTTTIA
jgi:hypothetical protein